MATGGEGVVLYFEKSADTSGRNYVDFRKTFVLSACSGLLQIHDLDIFAVRLVLPPVHVSSGLHLHDACLRLRLDRRSHTHSG